MSFFDVATNMGGNDAQIALINDLAKDLGFRQITPYSSQLAVEELTRKVPINFFLFASDGDLGQVKNQVHKIRNSPRPRVRFSPLICFIEVPIPLLISQCIQIGFDDIVTLPWDLTQMVPRLQRQINSPITYYETASYFGPDRRRFDHNRASATVYQKSQGYRRIDIRRDHVNGVHIMAESAVGYVAKRYSHMANSAAS